MYQQFPLQSQPTMSNQIQYISTTPTPFPHLPENTEQIIQKMSDTLNNQEEHIKRLKKQIRETSKKYDKLKEKHQNEIEFLKYSQECDDAESKQINVSNKIKKEAVFKKYGNIHPNFDIHKRLENLYINALNIINKLPNSTRYIRGNSLDKEITDAIMFADCAYSENNEYFKLKFAEKCRNSIYKINYMLKSFLRYGNCGAVDDLLKVFTESAEIFIKINQWIVKITRNLNIPIASIFITLQHPSLEYEKLLNDKNMHTDSKGKLIFENDDTNTDIKNIAKQSKENKKILDSLNKEFTTPNEFTKTLLPEEDKNILEEK